MTELKPCPFCGSVAYLEKNGDTYSVKAFHTDKCYLYGVKAPRTFIKEATVNRWNRRSNERTDSKG